MPVQHQPRDSTNPHWTSHTQPTQLDPTTSKKKMPNDTEPTWWTPTPTDQHQPLDFSTKTRVRIYPTQPPPPPSHSPALKFHHRPTSDHPPLPSDTTPLTMGFFRPSAHSPPSQPPQMPLFNFLDPMLVNDNFRPSGLLSGLSQLPFSFLDTRRPSTKNMRPFKAYPRDPLALPLGYCGLSSPVVPMDIQQGLLLNDDAYADFRKNVLLASSGAAGQVRDREKGSPRSPRSPKVEDEKREEEEEAVASSLSPDSSPPSSSTSCVVSGGSVKRKPRTLPDELKDDAYWERRRKNNEAAKRSRDARRAKEDEIAIRAAYLEQENLRLKVELATMKTETNRLRCLLYNS
uniref:BZIP domain-containing protein n=2 Tax=Strigamia maritima TaxID=126957 RepID=T1JLS6_STRMM